MWDLASSILNRTDVLMTCISLMEKQPIDSADWWIMLGMSGATLCRLLKSNDPIERTYHYANFKYIDIMPIKCIDICVTDSVIMLTFMLKYYLLCCWIILENIGCLKGVRLDSLALPVCCWLCSVCSASIG